ncbi:MAG: type 1 glutamine amidotransferase [Candidatus Micrarchaeota archaeon]|nr:type 1 glutamine amidotransferase [Candidatus Micrarchaeota archaeon]
MLQLRKPVLICQNSGRERPGHIETLLDKYFLSNETRHVGSMPNNVDPKSYSGVIVLGGPQSANDQTEVMLRELDFVKRTVAAGVPYFGICLGMQVLIKATGGIVRPNPVKEIGFRDEAGEPYLVTLEAEGTGSRLFPYVPLTFSVFQLHGETVDTVEGQKVLATGKHCVVQAVQVGSNAFGVQFHPELGEHMLGIWSKEDPDLAKKPLAIEDIRHLKTHIGINGRKIIENFINVIIKSMHQ